MLVKREGGRLRRRPVAIGSGGVKPAAVLAALILSTLILSALVPLSALWPAAAVAQTVAQKDWNRLDDPLTAALGVHVGKTGGTGLAFKFPTWWWLYVQVAGREFQPEWLHGTGQGDESGGEEIPARGASHRSR